MRLKAEPYRGYQSQMNGNLQAQRLAILWEEQKGAWFNYDLEKRKNLEFYPSNLTPLWAGCFSDPSVADKALKYLEVRGQWAGRPACHPGGGTLPSLQVSLRPLGVAVRQDGKGQEGQTCLP